MNKLVILGALIPVLALKAPQTFADPQHCYSYSECYNVGYGHGYPDGQNGYSAVDVCHNHSHSYCDGYYQGYRDAVSNNGNNGFHQGQSSQLSIHGNDNKVNINQAQNTQSGSNGGSSSHGANARCLLICTTVNH
jgi:hypothetical protein